MGMTGPQTMGWLNDDPTRRFFSAQMQATGRVMLQQVRMQQFPIGFTRIILQTLRQPGKLLARPVMQGKLLDEHELRSWVLPVLLMAASGHIVPFPQVNSSTSSWQRICAVAAASEFLGTALDVIDDVQDGDSPFVNHIGPPLAINVGIALLGLANFSLGRARTAGWPNELADTALACFNTSILRSLGGQFLDLRFQHMKDVSEEAVLAMTGQKSGTLVALICRLGALAGVETPQMKPPEYFEAVSQFGWHLGMRAQLLNDLRDAERAGVPAKSDRRLGKKTLPLVFEQRAMISGGEKEQQREASDRAALVYSHVVAETYRLRTQKALETLEEHFGPHPLLWPLLHPAREGG